MLRAFAGKSAGKIEPATHRGGAQSSFLKGSIESPASRTIPAIV
jgi:hypothetical protein